MAEAPYVFTETGKTQVFGNVVLTGDEANVNMYNKFKHQFTIRPLAGATGSVQVWGKFQGIREDDDEAGFEQLKDATETNVVINLAVPKSYIIEGCFQGFKLIPVGVVGSYEYSVIGW